MNQRLALQIAVGISAVIPFALGLNGILRGPDGLVKTNNYPFQVDSHFRCLSGFLVANGLFLLRSLPTIDRDASDLRRVCMLVFIGGLGRLYGFLTVGVETSAVLTNLVELFLLPAICIWQSRVQKNSKRTNTK